jgi:hypothetical protein
LKRVKKKESGKEENETNIAGRMTWQCAKFLYIAFTIWPDHEEIQRGKCGYCTLRLLSMCAGKKN